MNTKQQETSKNNLRSAELSAHQSETVSYANSGSLVSDACSIINAAGELVQRTVNWILVQRNWLLGKRIAEEELKGGIRAEYGAKAIRSLAQELTRIYGAGKGLDYGNLYKYLRFYKAFPRIVAPSRPQFATSLSWTHFRCLIGVPDEAARNWYAQEAAAQVWSVETLRRNIASQYYYRLLKAPDKAAVEAEMKSKTIGFPQSQLEFVKNPVIAEFLGMQVNRAYLETDLESCIIDNLQLFMMELGKGYAFVERQKRIATEQRDYFVDLVFYNYILKCFVLIDLKTTVITHQDVGQMDMYTRLFDEKYRQADDNPTLGLILCAETDKDVMQYSVLNDKAQLFASKYLLYLPSREQLREEIEHQKSLFYQRRQDAGSRAAEE